jgi:hypothetical protein
MPDGYPDTALEWSGNLLGRWNLGVDALGGHLPGVRIELDDLANAGQVAETAEAALPFFGRLFLNRDLDPAEAAALREFIAGNGEDSHTQLIDTLGLLVASPAFQWR